MPTRKAAHDLQSDGYVEAGSGKVKTPGHGKLQPFQGSATESEHDIQSYFKQQKAVKVANNGLDGILGLGIAPTKTQ